MYFMMSRKRELSLFLDYTQRSRWSPKKFSDNFVKNITEKRRLANISYQSQNGYWSPKCCVVK